MASTKQSQQTQHKYAESLRKRQQELEQGLARTVEQALKSAPDETQDVGDQAVSAYQKEMLFTQGTTHHLQLSQVRRALNRLAEGTYGVCQHCEATIGPKRLEALPWTPYCIDCQERIEKGEIEPEARVA